MSTDEDLGVVKEKQVWREKYIVPFVFIGFIVIRALDRIFLYRVQKSMADYTVNLDVMWSFFWSGMWQVFWGFLLYPLSWVPWPTPTGHNEAGPSTLSQDLKDSWTCFMGRNPKPSVTTCSAEPAWLWFMMYLLFNVFFNLFFLWLIKRLSGTWASIGSILCGNLCGVFSQFELFAGPSAQKLTMEQWMALILSSIAMWVYNIEEEVDVNGKSVYGEKEQGDHRYDTFGVMGVDPDEDEYASDDEPMAQDHTNF